MIEKRLPVLESRCTEGALPLKDCPEPPEATFGDGFLEVAKLLLSDSSFDRTIAPSSLII